MKKVYIYGITLILVLLIYQFPYLMLNPGELVSGHQDLKEKCFSCHQPFWGIENGRCISCHKPDEIGIKKVNASDINSVKKKVSFHDKLLSQKCTACHTDHNGIKPDVTLNQFNHELLSEAIRSKCNDCHEQPGDKLHPQLSTDCKNCHNTIGWKSSVMFNHDMIKSADKNNCVLCHQKPTDTFHISLEDNCNKCHTTTKWIPSTFDHSPYFQFDKNHNAKCNVCHTDNNYKAYTCYGCHEHSLNKIMSEHNEEGITNLNDCAECHKSGSEHDFKKNGNSGKGSDLKESEKSNENNSSPGNERENKNKDRKNENEKNEDDD